MIGNLKSKKIVKYKLVRGYKIVVKTTRHVSTELD